MSITKLFCRLICLVQNTLSGTAYANGIEPSLLTAKYQHNSTMAEIH